MIYCKHDIRNSIIGYKAERRKLYQDMAHIVERIEAMDQHMLRMEVALNNCAHDISYTPTLWERIKYGLWFLRKS
jgi:hypothetical protein